MRRRAVISYQWSVISGSAPSTKLKAEAEPEVRHAQQTRKPTASNGFSLVEVTLALAVMAIGLIAILGLIPQGVTSSRNAADNTLVATIVQDIFNTIRAQSFTSVDLSKYGSSPYQLGNPYNLRNSYPPSPLPTTTYFDQSGFNPATTEDSYFRVDLTIQPQNPPTPAVLSAVTVTVSWPAKPGMTATPLNASTFVTKIANYQ